MNAEGASSGFSIEPNPRATFKIHHEDPDVVVVEKPSGRVTQPGKGHERDTLLNGLFARWGKELQNLGAKRDFGLLHRLDKETSGLLLVALRPRAYDALREQFEKRQIRKFYWAVVKDAPREASGVIRRDIIEVKAPSGRDRATRLMARVSPSGKPAITAYRVLSRGPAASLVECRPVTGRLHQIRVHMDLIGCPVLGDDLYGPGLVRDAAPRLALHAHRLVFTHPVSGEVVDVRSSFPKDLRGVLSRLGLARPDLDAPSGKDGGEELPGDAVGEEEALGGEDEA